MLGLLSVLTACSNSDDLCPIGDAGVAARLTCRSNEDCASSTGTCIPPGFPVNCTHIIDGCLVGCGGRTSCQPLDCPSSYDCLPSCNGDPTLCTAGQRCTRHGECDDNACESDPSLCCDDRECRPGATAADEWGCAPTECVSDRDCVSRICINGWCSRTEGRCGLNGQFRSR